MIKNKRLSQVQSTLLMLDQRKGDIPITILVFGVLTICLIAILSFYFSDRAVKNNFDSIGLIEQAVVIKEKISFYENLGFSEDEISKIFEIKSDAIGRYFILKEDRISVRYNLGK